MENRYEGEIEPCCRKQYVLFGYLKEFGVRDGTPDDPEKRVLNLFRSPQEQIMVLSRFGLIGKLFETLSANRKYMEAYEVGVSLGLSVNSIQLVKSSLKNLKQVPGAQLNTLCNILQAEHIATNPWPRAKGAGGIHKVLRAAARGGSQQIKLFVKMWEDINRAFDMSARHKTRVEIGKISDMQIASYVDILVFS